MSLWLSFCLLALGADTAVVEQQGTIELRRVASQVEVRLRSTNPPVLLTLYGAKVNELRQLQSAQVRVRGIREGKTINVESYDLISVYGKTPIVGQITEISGKIGISDGDGPPILLSLAPRSYRRLLDARGKRAWVIGEMLLSGELKVGRYGIFPEVPVKNRVSPTVSAEGLK